MAARLAADSCLPALWRVPGGGKTIAQISTIGKLINLFPYNRPPEAVLPLILDLIVEILSPGTVRLDRLVKYQLYAGYGVRWYWIVYPEEKICEEYALEKDSFALKTNTDAGEIFRPLLFPRLEIPVVNLWL